MHELVLNDAIFIVSSCGISFVVFPIIFVMVLLQLDELPELCLVGRATFLLKLP